MKINRDESVSARRSRWMDACGVATCLSFLLIVCHVALPPIAGVSMPYSGGGAAVLGIGAMLCLALESGSARLASAIGLVGLMILRALSPIRPDLIVAEHGELTMADAGGLVLLIITALWMVCAAAQRSTSGLNRTQQPTGGPSGSGG
ncbi:MAG: hypothetical protein RL885_14565 [Planctomycetota bacterium]